MEDSKYFHIRVSVIALFLAVCLTAFVGVLYSTQIVHGQDYLEQSVRTITQRETVEASRGILTDRNGKTLVSNRLSYTLTFDSSLLDKGENEAEAIWNLIQLCQRYGVEWVENLPITAQAPFAFALDGLDSTQSSRFIKYLQANKWIADSLPASYRAEEMTRQEQLSAYLKESGLSADTLLAGMRTVLGVPASYSDSQARSVMGVQYELAVRKLVNTSAYIFAVDVSTEMISEITDGDYPGVKVGSSSVRDYQTDAAAHILGFVGRMEDEYEELKDKGYSLDDLVGKSGVELAFEEYLHGTDGTRVVSKNSEGKTTSELYTKAPQPGSTVSLTIDLPFQEAVETALAKTVGDMTEKDGISRGGGAAVVQVGTGEVMALASYPTYNLATYSQDSAELNTREDAPLFNRATQGTYPPGSTFKPLTAIAALEEGVVTPSEKIRDTGRWYYPQMIAGSEPFGLNCWNRSGHGLVNITEAITVSCNYFFYQMGYLLGIDRIDEYAAAFGLGQPTGIEIDEKSGTLASPAAREAAGGTWYGGDTVQAAIGQSDHLFTPLQLANYVATIVSGGKHYPAHLLKSVKSYDNSELLYAGVPDPLNTVSISDSTLNVVKTGMHGLVTSGSLSSYFANCVVDAGAKTGTAQLGAKIKDNGILVCFAPYDDPEIALAIVIEKGGSGAALASTAVEILNSYFSTDEIGAALIGEDQLLQ
ncbi:penicillin-binding protein A [Oscillibacter sp. MSJ-2]|uniref:Penicillin-binding protein A n=1 Tax=Dysosmobacter acutus TaxID=2841504 RepID=A0ABS6F663_9FIRM|nr:penicillin-binding transpeptidase domain-containing protein [Dysosmobacter acutus]MBU5625784.1 penicillin-binding protein A [Dysosmobacter acutus]